MSRSTKSLFIALLALGLIAANPATAKDATPAAITTADPTIPMDELDIIAAPMTVDELKAEADGWKALVKQAAEKVAEAKLRIKRASNKQKAAEEKADVAEQAQQQAEEKPQDTTTEEAKAEAEKQQAEAVAEEADEKKDVAMDELTALRGERTALINRLDIILQRINQKIGLDEKGKEKEDVAVYRRYIDAVGGIKLDTSDAESMVSSLQGWLFSKDGGMRWAINIAIFLGILIAFWILAGLLSHATRKALSIGGNQSVLLESFLVGMVRRITIAVGIIVALSALEVNIGPLLAIIGAVGFVVAFALQDTLGNFASGIMLMMYRPFDVNDIVEVAGIMGKVKSLNLVSTTITTPDNKRMVVPNNKIWGDIITNATGSATRRVDMTFGIDYGDDIGHAKQVLKDIVAAHPKVLKDPAPVVQMHELADSSVNFVCRPWTNTPDYWSVYWDITRTVKERFDAEGLSFPFPQRDIHVYQETTATTSKDSHSDKQDSDRAGEQMGLEEASD